MKLIYETCENGFKFHIRWVKNRKQERIYSLSSVKIPGPMRREKIYMDYGSYGPTFTGVVTGRMVGSVGRNVDTSERWVSTKATTLGCWVDAVDYYRTEKQIVKEMYMKWFLGSKVVR